MLLKFAFKKYQYFINDFIILDISKYLFVFIIIIHTLTNV